MKINSRTVNFYEIQLTTTSRDKAIQSPAQTPIAVLMPFLATHIPTKHEIPYARTPIEVTASHWNASESELYLLLNIVDPEKSDVAYRKRSTRSRRLGNKEVDEDIEVSSHVVIRATDGCDTAKMGMTIGAGIPPGKIVALLRDIYSNQSSSTFIKKLTNPSLPTAAVDRKGKPVTYKVKHSMELNGMPNGTLLDIIRTGQVTGVDLIDTGIYAFDSSSTLSVDKMQMHVQLKASAVDVPLLKRIIRSAAKNRQFSADKIRIEYRDGDDEKTKKTQTFDSARLDEAFTRSEQIKLDITHHDHQTQFSEEILNKISQLL